MWRTHVVSYDCLDNNYSRFKYIKLDNVTVKPSQAYPQDYINEFIIRKLNPLVVVDFRFMSIHFCILACVMSREFTRESVAKFLPAKFP